MTNLSENRTPKETSSGNAAGGLYHGTGEFLGRFCFERETTIGNLSPVEAAIEALNANENPSVNDQQMQKGILTKRTREKKSSLYRPLTEIRDSDKLIVKEF
jgi:hypothetical protein